MKTASLLTLALFFLFGLALAGQPGRIELNDGSVVIGEIVNIDNGTYTIHSEGMGQLRIEESRIKQISFPGFNPALAPVDQAANVLSSSNIDSMAGKLMSNPETAGLVASLQNDPQFEAILNDPEITNALKSGNSASLIGNEKFMQLKDNPAIQKIKEKTTQ